jgi:hypothetical protein
MLKSLTFKRHTRTRFYNILVQQRLLYNIENLIMRGREKSRSTVVKMIL